MKKEIVVGVIIVCLIVVMNIITQKYTNKSMDDVKEQLESMREVVLVGNKDESEAKMDELMNNWDDMKEKLELYIEHAEIEKLEMYILDSRSYIETEEYNMAYGSLRYV